ncbi:MAG: DUF2188 domain-containing protein [Gemmatimonadota bacterium]
MSEENVYEVGPRGQWWEVRQTRGPAQAWYSSHFKKDAAVDAGRTLARRSKPSRLVIRNRDGSIRDEYTYRDHGRALKGR